MPCFVREPGTGFAYLQDMTRSRFVLVLFVVLLAALPCRGVTVNDLSRIKGQGQFKLQGFGLVMGLAGTGDDGKDLVLARPLAAALSSSGSAPGALSELSRSRSCALVLVTCTIKESGGRADDRFDVTVSVVNSAKSLKGGQLYITPMRGPTRLHTDVMAFAEGGIEVDDEQVPTVGRVRGGAQLVKDVNPLSIAESFDILIETPFVGYTSASEIAGAINAAAQPQGPGVAAVIDDRTIRVTIPEYEREDKAAFIAAVQSADVDVGLLGLGAMVIYNSRRGAIIVTADVEISPVAITQKDLSIATTMPAPVPSAKAPVVETQRWAGVRTRGRANENAKLSDLLAAFKSLQIPVSEQIGILEMLHKTGKLHAKLVVD